MASVSQLSHNLQALDNKTLERPPSCVEFWPLHPDYFIVGTYELEQTGNNAAGTMQPESRNGSLLLFKVLPSSAARQEVSLIQTLQYPHGAIYDLHFHPRSPEYFAISSSTGAISLYTISILPSDSSNLSHIAHVGTYRLFPEDVLVTYFSWCPSSRGPQSATVVVALSNGEVHLLCSNGENDRGVFNNSVEASPPEEFRLEKLDQLTSHQSYEAWCCAWSSRIHPDGSTMLHYLYSGGDDSKLRLSVRGTAIDDAADSLDVRIPNQIFKGHEAGITAILPLPLGPSFPVVILTGSYDDHVRIISIPDLGLGGPDSKYEVLSELKLGAGIYRLKLHYDCPLKSANVDDEFSFQVIASCMQAGSRILEVSWSGKWAVKVLAWSDSKDDDQLCYASAIQPIPTGYDLQSKPHRSIFVSTSFYTKDLLVLEYNSAVKIEATC